jgi:hypothetical protein
MRLSQAAHAMGAVPGRHPAPYVALQYQRSMQGAFPDPSEQESEKAMTDIAYETARSTLAAQPAQPAERTGFIARILNAVYEARMRQAEREIRRYAHLVPRNILEQTEFGSARKDGGLPFVR